MFISQGIDSCFVGTVVSIDFQEENKEFADNIITTFRVVSTGLDNGTRVTCRTLDEEEVFHSSTKLYFSGIPGAAEPVRQVWFWPEHFSAIK